MTAAPMTAGERLIDQFQTGLEYVCDSDWPKLAAAIDTELAARDAQNSIGLGKMFIHTATNRGCTYVESGFIDGVEAVFYRGPGQQLHGVSREKWEAEFMPAEEVADATGTWPAGSMSESYRAMENLYNVVCKFFEQVTANPDSTLGKMETAARWVTHAQMAERDRLLPDPLLRRHVEKVRGYRYPGVIIGIVRTLAGQRRYIVEADHPDFAGMLHIFSREQLTARDVAGQKGGRL